MIYKNKAVAMSSRCGHSLLGDYGHLTIGMVRVVASQGQGGEGIRHHDGLRVARQIGCSSSTLYRRRVDAPQLLSATPAAAWLPTLSGVRLHGLLIVGRSGGTAQTRW
jgi:hypothetical protein